jgi:hypothetical protein
MSIAEKVVAADRIISLLIYLFAYSLQISEVAFD